MQRSCKDEIRRHLATGAIEPATSRQYVSPAFVVRSGFNDRRRLVFDYTSLNDQMRKESFKYENLTTVSHIMRHGCC